MTQDVEALYQQMILTFGRAGLRSGCVALVYSHIKRPPGFRFVPGKLGDPEFEQSLQGYDLVKVFVRKPDNSLPRYVELDEALRHYHEKKAAL